MEKAKCLIKGKSLTTFLYEEILFNSTKKNELYMSTALSLEGIKLTEQSQSQSITPLAQHYQNYIYKTEWHLPEVWFGGDVCQFVMLAHGRPCGYGTFYSLPIVVVIHTHERININQN